MTDNLIEQIKADRECDKDNPGACVNVVPTYPCDARCPCALEARILADAKVIEAANTHLVKRLKSLQTYFDLSEEELDTMTRDERADCLRQHRLITEALAAFNAALAEQEEEDE